MKYTIGDRIRFTDTDSSEVYTVIALGQEPGTYAVVDDPTDPSILCEARDEDTELDSTGDLDRA